MNSLVLVYAVYLTKQKTNHAFLICLPKGDGSTLPDGTALHDPADTRPLSIVDASNRILASILLRALERQAESWISPMQRGFLKGRQMLRNILEIDFSGQTNLRPVQRQRDDLIRLSRGLPKYEPRLHVGHACRYWAAWQVHSGAEAILRRQPSLHQIGGQIFSKRDGAKWSQTRVPFVSYFVRALCGYTPERDFAHARQ